ncbi:MAG: hypothetical protein V7672_00690 [Brevundimonas sp.]|uniref:phage head spike fiber domain-containing protein n=1 Tax=Brevundimonas sp. TaxID=1871086 RepID=UPI0030013D63
MSDAVVTVVDQVVHVSISGSELLTPLVSAAAASAAAAGEAETGAETARDAAEGFRDEAEDRTAAVLAILARADLYGITETTNAVAFMAGGVEVLPLSSYFRSGGSVSALLSGLSGISITRASVGYARTAAGTYTSFASGAARITDRGLMVEPAATNLFPRFAPTAAQLSTGANAADTTAPSSPPIAGLNWLTLTNTSGTANALQPVTLAVSTTYTMSVLVETPDGSQPVAGPLNGTGDFSFVLSNVTQASGTPRYERLSGNVWRVSLTVTTPGTLSSTSNGIVRFSAQNNRICKFAGFQIETGSRATSPIVTTGATATRAADVIQLPGLSIGQEVTVLADVALTGGDSSILSGSRFLFDLDDGGTSNRIYANNVSGGFGFATVVSSSTTGSVEVAGTAAVDATVKLAYRSKVDDFRMARGGTLSTVDTSGAVPSSFSRLTIGGISGGTLQLSGFIRRLVVIPAARDDAELQALTA